MPKNNPPEKKRARALQRETGRPYTSCLAEVRAQIAAEQADPPQSEPTPEATPPTNGGLFSRT